MAVLGSKVSRLKDGRSMVIRTGEERDAVRLIEVAQSLLSNGVGQVLEPVEFNMSEEQERAWVRGIAESATEILLIAECDGLITGILDFHTAKRRRRAHTGYFGMSVREGWRGLGVGRALMETLKGWAISTGKIEKINLRVLANNEPAIQLFQSLGFRVTGRRSREVKLAEGQYVDELSMELIFH